MTNLTETKNDENSTDSAVRVERIVICIDCEMTFDPKQSIDNEICDDCRMQCAPCLGCGAIDEYQAGEMCTNAGENDHCQGCDIWG